MYKNKYVNRTLYIKCLSVSENFTGDAYGDN